jgi:anti-sigma B factor antagonist
MKEFLVFEKNFDNIKILNLKGFLDASSASKLEDSISNCLNSGYSKIIANLSELEYISSAGMGVFIAFLESIRENGGDIKFCEIPEKVFFVFDLLGFQSIFEIYQKEEEALKAFGKKI